MFEFVKQMAEFAFDIDVLIRSTPEFFSFLGLLIALFDASIIATVTFFLAKKKHISGAQDKIESKVYSVIYELDYSLKKKYYQTKNVEDLPRATQKAISKIKLSEKADVASNVGQLTAILFFVAVILWKIILVFLPVILFLATCCSMLCLIAYMPYRIAKSNIEKSLRENPKEVTHDGYS
jgi:uncharacterized membrane protein